MNIGLIGYGYWGKILLSKLEKLGNVKFICTSKDDYKNKLNLVDWIFVATPNDTHFDIVKQCIENNKNVFCEKPLTPTYKQSIKLFELANKHKTKLYVNDVFNYRTEQKDIKSLVEPIKVVWNKISNNTLYDLMYHDLYLLKPFWSTLPNINFIYGESDDRIHMINDINFTTTKSSNDALMKMIQCVLSDNVDYEYNKLITLFCNKAIDDISNNTNI
tara:strand:- start:322 stop:972 length:651 start_codon:yes stop_codon:yes gene_type:complete